MFKVRVYCCGWNWNTNLTDGRRTKSDTFPVRMYLFNKIHQNSLTKDNTNICDLIFASSMLKTRFVVHGYICFIHLLKSYHHIGK